MAKCKCGCGQELEPGTARQYKNGHKSNPIGNVKRLCACGCGNPVKNRWPFIKGHDKAGDSRSDKTPPQQTNGQAPIKVHLPPVALASPAACNVKVTCSVSELAMDRIWTRLSPEEKAQLLFPTETEPAHA